ncbi:hypothetical protein [Acidilobus sp.]
MRGKASAVIAFSRRERLGVDMSSYAERARPYYLETGTRPPGGSYGLSL